MLGGGGNVMKEKVTLVYISLSGNTDNFVRRLSKHLEDWHNLTVDIIHVKDLVKENIPFYNIQGKFVAFLPTYLEGGNGIDNGDVEILTNPLGDFIAFGNNTSNCLGIVGSGNKNFNNQYCLTAKQYSKRFGFPVLDNYELRGTPQDVERIAQKIVDSLE